MSAVKQPALVGASTEAIQDYQRRLEEDFEARQVATRRNICLMTHVFGALQVKPSWWRETHVEYQLFQERDEPAKDVFERYRVLRDEALKEMGEGATFVMLPLRAISSVRFIVPYRCASKGSVVLIEIWANGELPFWTGSEACAIKEQTQESYAVSCPAGATP